MLGLISRRSHNEVVETMERAMRELRSDIAAERARGKQLLDTIIDMKMGGATLLRSRADQLERIAATGTAEKAKAPRSAIDQAIDENKHASRNPALRRHLATWATREIENGRDADDVLGELRTWDRVREDDEDEDENGGDVIDLRRGGDDVGTPHEE